MNKGGFVYILASQRNGTLYIGVTNDLVHRVYEHRSGEIAGFTQRYGATCLVYFERHEEIAPAIAREKQLKNWKRRWKLDLIEHANPDWADLWPEIIGEIG